MSRARILRAAVNQPCASVSISVQDIVFQLQRLVTAMAKYHTDCHKVLQEAQVFPIEFDLTRSMFSYNTSGQFTEKAVEEEGQDLVKGLSDTYELGEEDLMEAGEESATMRHFQLISMD